MYFGKRTIFKLNSQICLTSSIHWLDVMTEASLSETSVFDTPLRSAIVQAAVFILAVLKNPESIIHNKIAFDLDNEKVSHEICQQSTSGLICFCYIIATNGESDLTAILVLII